jgi:hypothetical protein
VPEAIPEPSLAERVERILLHTESAVDSIVRRVEHQVRDIAAEVDSRAARDAIERSTRLEELRRDLSARAIAIAHGYEQIVRQLNAVESVLAAMAARTDVRGSVDATLTGVRMTLRERGRISVAYEAPPPGVPVETPAPVEMNRRGQRLRWLRRSA